MSLGLYQKKSDGFTIIELMFVLLIAGVLIAVGVPSFSTVIKSNQLTSATNEVIGALNFARTEAVKRGASVHFGLDADGRWVVWIDGGDNEPGTTDDIPVRIWQSPEGGVTVNRSSSDDFYIFNGAGFSDKSETFTFCDDRSGELGSAVSLLVSGSVSRSSVTCS